MKYGKICYKNIYEIRNHMFIFENNKKIKIEEKIKQFVLDSEKSTNLFDTKKKMLPNYLFKNFFHRFFDKLLSLLLCQINVLSVFNMYDYFQIFGILRRPEILIDSNF